LLELFFIVKIIISSCGSTCSDEINNIWKLTFGDDFNTLDTNIWRGHYIMRNRTIWSRNEAQWNKDENVTVENGILKITTKKIRSNV